MSKTKWVAAGTLDENPENLVPLEKVKNASWEGSLVFGTLGQMDEDGMDVERIYAAARETQHVDLRVLINGYEYPASAFIAKWEKAFEYAVAKKARELVMERTDLRDKTEQLHDILDTVTRTFKDSVKEAFPHARLDEEEDY